MHHPRTDRLRAFAPVAPLLALALTSAVGCGGSSEEPIGGDGRADFVFTSERDGSDDLFVMDAAGGGRVRLTDHPAREASASFSPDGSTIVFLSDRGLGSPIHLMDADGGNVRQLQNHVLSWGTTRGRTSSPISLALSPVFRPDGQKVLFVVPTERPEVAGIYLMNLDGSEPTRLPVEIWGDTRAVAFHPDGQRVVFTRGGDIYVANVDGSGEARLTETTGGELTPRFSPDGATVLFLRSEWNAAERRYDYDLYSMAADGSGVTRLTETGRESGGTFSRDGSTIIFSSGRDGDSEIYSMRSDGTSETRLTRRRGYDITPAAR